MRFSEAILALGALSSYASAYEAEDGFSATAAQVDSGRKVWRHGASEMKRTILKFGGNVSDEIENAIAAAGKSGSVKNKPVAFDALYLTPTDFGTPGKVHMMDIDTGSSDVWVFSTLQPASQRAGHAVYNPSASSTSRRTSAKFHAKYGDGSSAHGPVYLDKVTLAGITVAQQGIGAANHVSKSFQEEKAEDGIFGFAFNKLSTSGAPTWFSNAKLKKDVICADLKHKKPGFYDIGFINKAHFSGKIHYVPISRRLGFWQFTAKGVKFGKTTKRHSINAIADTGTSIALLPDAVLKPYYAKIRHAFYEPEVAGYIFPCSATPPAYSIHIGSSFREIPGRLISFEQVGTVNGKEYCLGGLQRNTGLEGMSILGDTFLKSQYVVFDAANNRIGFADK